MLHRLTLAEMSAQLRARKISPSELTAAHWQQIDRTNPAINAFVRQLRSESLADAWRLDDAQWTGPLHGIPVTVKDSFDMEGLPTYCGSRFRLDHCAASDSTAVARLRSAGAIILGKTNCPEFLGNWETDNFITGRTNNPWNLDLTAGGSSGGESAAISAFCSAGGIGSDGGGSIRVPAHFCGIAGLKPTPGRIPAAGHYPRIGHPGGLLGVAGPMARTVEDVRILFGALAGYDAADPFSAPVPIRAFDTEGIRVGLVQELCGVPVQDAVRTALGKAAKAFEELTVRVEPFEADVLEQACEVWWFFFGRIAAQFTREIYQANPSLAHWTGTELPGMVPEDLKISSREVVEMLAAREQIRLDLLRQMERYRVLLTPVSAVTAFPHRQRSWKIGTRDIGLLEAMAAATPFNLTSLPALAIPFDVTPDGIPVGIQLVGRPYEEELLLELGSRLEMIRGPFPTPAL